MNQKWTVANSILAIALSALSVFSLYTGQKAAKEQSDNLLSEIDKKLNN